MQAVKMYTTAVCPYCVRAKQILKAKGVAHIEEIRVDANPEERQRMMDLTGRRTVPQIFINNRGIGGCDNLMELDSTGWLDQMLGIEACPASPSTSTRTGQVPFSPTPTAAMSRPSASL